MTYKEMDADLYHKLLHYYNENLVDSITFYPYHKGLEVTINGALKSKAERKSLESGLAEWWYDCHFEEGGEMTLKTNAEGILCFTSQVSVDWKKWGIEGDIKDLCEDGDIAPHLDLDEEPFDLGRVSVSYSVSGDSTSADDYSYSLYYYSDEHGEIDLSDNEELKKTMIANAFDWATQHSQYSSADNYSFSLEVEDSHIHSFEESAFAGIIELEPVKDR